MDLSAIPYIPARNGPGLTPIDARPADIIVMHSMECPPDDIHVTNWVNALNAPTGGNFFAHYYTGPNVVYQVAPTGRTEWHCGNGNEVAGKWTLGVEQAGYAAQTRDEWIAAGSLHTASPLVAALIANGHGAPVWLEVADLLRPGVRGVTSHNNMSHAFGGSDHTDPGPNYPHDLLLATPAPPAPQPTSVEDNMIATGQNADGRLETFEGQVDGRIRHKWQIAPNATWSDWVDMGAPAGTCARGLSVGRNADGRLELFAIAADYSVTHCWQIAPNATWAPWTVL